VGSAAPRFIGYVRVSTGEQAESGLGLAEQEREIRVAAARRGWTLTEVITDTRTGANLKRPGIRRALKAIAKARVDGIVVAKLDRVSRSASDTAVLLDWIANEARADFVALDVEWADTTTPQGKLMIGLFALLAEYFRGLTAERTSAALRQLKAQGRAYGPGAVSDQPELARTIRRWRTHGFPGVPRPATLAEICSRLNANGVPTPRGGTQWRPSSLQTVLGWQRPPKRRPQASLPRVNRARA
jgi:DNA invertase Pin-like site-specific DNA recombinase